MLHKLLQTHNNMKLFSDKKEGRDVQCNMLLHFCIRDNILSPE